MSTRSRPATGLDGGGAGVAGGGADDRYARVAGGQDVVEQAAEHLQRHVLEGERRAVEQLLDEQVGLELDQRDDGGVVEGGVGVVEDRGQSVAAGSASPMKGCMMRAASAG